jgi:hypothetical protein
MTAPYIAGMRGMSRGLLDSLQAVAGPVAVDTLPDDLLRRAGYEKRSVRGWYDRQNDRVYVHPRQAGPYDLAHEFGHRLLAREPGFRNSETGASIFAQEMMRATGRPSEPIAPIAIATDRGLATLPDTARTRERLKGLIGPRLREIGKRAMRTGRDTP